MTAMPTLSVNGPTWRLFNRGSIGRRATRNQYSSDPRIMGTFNHPPSQHSFEDEDQLRDSWTCEHRWDRGSRWPYRNELRRSDRSSPCERTGNAHGREL